MSIILLHSKYSESCKQLLNALGSLQLPFQIQTLSVDNKIVKDRIRKSALDIKQVPCLLVTNKEGQLEKYEAGMAFQWFNNLMQQMRPPPPPPQHQPPPPPPPRQMRRTPVVEDLTDQQEYEIEPEEEDDFARPPPPEIKKKTKSTKKGGGKKATFIEEIPLDDTDNDLMGNEPSATEVIDEPPNIKDQMEEEREEMSRNMRSRNNKKKQSNGILQMAQEMQKSREAIEPKNKQIYDN